MSTKTWKTKIIIDGRKEKRYVLSSNDSGTLLSFFAGDARDVAYLMEKFRIEVGDMSNAQTTDFIFYRDRLPKKILEDGVLASKFEKEKGHAPKKAMTIPDDEYNEITNIVAIYMNRVGRMPVLGYTISPKRLSKIKNYMLCGMTTSSKSYNTLEQADSTTLVMCFRTAFKKSKLMKPTSVVPIGSTIPTPVDPVEVDGANISYAK